MGSWRNRPHRFYRPKPKQPPTSPPRSHELEPDNVPFWEKRFCSVIGSVPWWKVVNAKKLMYCCPNVLNWDDSAGEEAFHNAKRRFWANMNRLPCDISLPDPDIYIDKVNWNPNIDPILVEELDRAYFAPDDERKNVRGNKKSSPLNGYSGDQCANDNPWEGDNVQDSGTFKDGVQDWKQWDSHAHELWSTNNENPWETSNPQASGLAKITGWGQNKDSSWVSEQERNNSTHAKLWNNDDDPWKHGCEAVSSVKDKRWSDVGNNNSWGVNRWQSRNSSYGDNPWNNGSYNNVGQRGRADSSRGWKRCENYPDEPKILEHNKTSAGWEPWSEGSQKKREDSHWHIPAYKRSRFQGDGYQSGNYWNNGRGKRRVSFAP